MHKFILSTLFILSWAFYELSGGEDFVPGAQLAEAPVSTTSLPQAEPKPSGGFIAAAQAADSSAQVMPAVAAANEAVLTPTPAVATTTRIAPTKVMAEPIEAPKRDILAKLDPSVADLPRATISAVVFDETGMGSALRPEGGEAAAEPAAAGRDIRTVSGNRVNLRMGPGTNYNVLTSLSRGDEVEVLQQPGNGWVKLKSMNGNSIGWMAEYLVSAAD
ncbi:SH3 domain-containing protein [Pseudooceanicola nanhaiensis]|uniref:SH3 domain-containing protein n=1 Tax=Pseudooceanicola nanhaiensis TaxID=375761 RepID=UPI001CD49BFC|nr:SH3 domain-containing protein [Pseudooceanicola nanhaiensis]MCA0919090.1 SH3 domain-containing protein [Pseudooceanicola nanhaiensis]